MLLILVRGLPGSGKSTVARRLCREIQYSYHIEADMFWVMITTLTRTVSEAHAWCLDGAKVHLHRLENVIVSNTFTTIDELRPYFSMARDRGVTPAVITCYGQFGSIHGVPSDIIEKMRTNFAHDISELYNTEVGSVS